MNGVENASRGERQPFLIRGPGEYEVKEIVVRGFGSTSNYRSQNRANTIYTVSLEGMNLCHLGALSSTDLPQEAKEELDDIDVLFVPIGGEGVLDAAAAHKIAVSLEPRLIVPVHHGDLGAKDSLKRFLKEEGEEGLASVEKLTLKKKDLEGKGGDIVVLSS
jgi:L-ascorbate metabolism protein UlaG (beta-lactamase superfamily)